jgi:hypothetical protein
MAAAEDGLDASACVLEASEDEAQLSLLTACMRNDVRGVRAALAAGVDPNAAATRLGPSREDAWPRTALFLVTDRSLDGDDFACARALLDAKADPDGAGPFTESLAASEKTQPRFSPLLQACATGRAKTVALLLRAGAGERLPEQPAGVGNPLTPLMLACRQAHPECVRLLLAHGHDTRSTMLDGPSDFDGASALDMALRAMCGRGVLPPTGHADSGEAAARECAIRILEQRRADNPSDFSSEHAHELRTFCVMHTHVDTAPSTGLDVDGQRRRLAHHARQMASVLLAARVDPNARSIDSAMYTQETTGSGLLLRGGQGAREAGTSPQGAAAWAGASDRATGGATPSIPSSASSGDTTPFGGSLCLGAFDTPLERCVYLCHHRCHHEHTWHTAHAAWHRARAHRPPRTRESSRRATRDALESARCTAHLFVRAVSDWLWQRVRRRRAGRDGGAASVARCTSDATLLRGAHSARGRPRPRPL